MIYSYITQYHTEYNTTRQLEILVHYADHTEYTYADHAGHTVTQITNRSHSITQIRDMPARCAQALKRGDDRATSLQSVGCGGFQFLGAIIPAFIFLAS